MNKLKALICVVCLSFGTGEIASATIITGTPTLNGDFVQVGVVSGDNTIFFIPLDRAGGGTYGWSPTTSSGAIGYNLIGTTQDTVWVGESANKPIAGGHLDMYMYFHVPSGEIGTDLKLSFNDLDLSPWNDPSGFFERLTLYGQSGLPNGTYETVQGLEAETNVLVEPDYLSTTTSNEMDIYFSGLSIPSGDFWLHMGLEAYSLGLPTGWWTNTKEKVTAAVLHSEPLPTTSSIPEPSTLILLTSGILGMFGYAQRRKKNG